MQMCITTILTACFTYMHECGKGGRQVKMREVIERIRHMLKVKDCRHLCLTCEYYEICKREVNADEYEIRNEK